jgi:hypothetical protein
VTWQELVQNVDLLGRALADDISPTIPNKRLSKWTMATRRSAVRKFIALLRDDLMAASGEDPDSVLDSALRSVAEPVGLGFRLNGGAPRRRGGDVPTSEQVAAVLATLGQADGYRGNSNRAFYGILAESGARERASNGRC